MTYQDDSPSGNIDAFYQNFIEAGISGEKHPFVAAAQQMVENSDDAGAKRIDFFIEPGKHFRCVDDGIGVMRNEMMGLNRLGFRNNNKGFDKTGKNGSGRSFNMKVAEETHSRFCSKDFPMTMLHRFTRDHVKWILSHCDKSLPNPISVDENVPNWCPLGGERTGMAVELVGVDWDLFRTTNQFKNRLSDILSVWTARKTYLNRELLPQRGMEEERERVFDLPKEFAKCLMRVVSDMKKRKELKIDIPIEALLSCRCHFYRAPKPTKRDKISFGKNPLCSMEAFVTGIRDEVLADQIPEWMSGRTVAGLVDLPVMNLFAHHGRGSLNPAIYDDKELIEQITYFISEVIAPWLEVEYDLQTKKADTPEKLSDLKRVASMFGEGKGSARGGVADTADMDRPHSLSGGRNKSESPIWPSHAELLVGVEQPFHIVRGPKNGKWNAKKSGGSIDTEVGKQVWYTAGDVPGKYSLEYVPPEGDKVIIRIEVLESRRFQLNRKFHDIYPGQEFKVMIRGYDDEDITFEIHHQGTKRPTPHIRCESVGKEARFISTPDCPPDFYRFTAKTPGGERDEGVVHVHRRPGEFIRIGEMDYEIGTDQTQRGELVDIIRRHGESPKMSINLDRDPLSEIERQYGKAGEFFQTLRIMMVTAHVMDQNVDDPLGLIQQLTTQVMKDSKERENGGKRSKKSS